MWIDFQVKAFPGRQGFCVRESCSTPPGNEVAAAVTCSHPARLASSAATTYLGPMPSGFEFCLPTKSDAVPTGPDLLHEVKYDGYRLRVERDGDRVRLITRGGYNWTDRYPLISAAACKLKAPSFVVDGEAVWLDLMANLDLNQRTDLDRTPTM
jgi:ATP-dependent DNA ligase